MFWNTGGEKWKWLYVEGSPVSARASFYERFPLFFWQEQLVEDVCGALIEWYRQGKSTYSKENLSHCHFFHQKSHTELGPLSWDWNSFKWCLKLQNVPHRELSPSVLDKSATESSTFLESYKTQNISYKSEEFFPGSSLCML
jgi:hypothetical protein